MGYIRAPTLGKTSRFNEDGAVEAQAERIGLLADDVGFLQGTYMVTIPAFNPSKLVAMRNWRHGNQRKGPIRFTTKGAGM